MPLQTDKHYLDGTAAKEETLAGEAPGPLPEEQIKCYLQEELAANWEPAYKKIRSNPCLMELTGHPQLFRMLVTVLRDIKKYRRETSAARVYEVYIQRWLESREEAAGASIKKIELEALLEEMAYDSWGEKKEAVSPERFFPGGPAAAMTILDSVPFLSSPAPGHYTFSHPSFQEFFVAGKLKKALGEKDYSLLDLHRVSPHMVFFLRHLADNDRKLVQAASSILGEPYRQNISENALILFYYIIMAGSLKSSPCSFSTGAKISAGEYENLRKKLKKRLPRRLNLHSAMLNQINLPGMVFKNADFTGANLENSNLVNSFFHEVVFKKTRLTSGDFSHSHFKQVRFEMSRGYECRFRNCRFEDCSFLKSGFNMSDFMGAQFSGCTIEDNDFTGAGFLHSNIDLTHHQRNWFFGIGKPDTDLSHLTPYLKLGEKYPLDSVVIGPDNRFIVSGGEGETVRVWDLAGGRLIKTFKGPSDFVSTVFVSSDNRWVISAGADHILRVWGINRGQLIQSFEGHRERINTVTVSRDNRYIVSGSSDQTVKMWDISEGKLLRTFEGHKGRISSVAASSDLQLIVSGSDDRSVKIWDANAGSLVKTLVGHGDFVTSVALSPDHRLLVSGSDDRTAKLWDVESGGLIRTFEGHDDFVTSVAFSPDSRRILSISEDNTVKIWKISNGTLEKTIRGHKAPLRSKPDRTGMPPQTSEQTVTQRRDSGEESVDNILEIASNNLLKLLEGKNDYIGPVSFDQHQARKKSGSQGVRFWEISSDSLIKTFLRHSHWISSVSISQDNRYLAAICPDNTLKLWDIENGEAIYSIALLPGDGTILFKNNRFYAQENALQWLYYTDGLASYPASHLPELCGGTAPPA